MIVQYSPILILLLLAGTISAILTYIGWRNRAIPISLAFTLLMAAETAWIFGYALEVTSTTLPTVLLLNTIMYPALQTVPVAWLFIVLIYTGREEYITRRTIPLFFLVPALVWIFVVTNPYHHLYYTGFYPQAYNGSVIWIYEHGPLFWIHIGYCYLLALVAIVLAASRIFVSTELYRRQMILLLCAASIPALFNVAYVFRLTPFPEYDLTPIAFLLTEILLAVGLLRYQLFSAVPVAYSLVFSTMKDGVIVANRQYRVIDLNPAAEEITGVSSHDAIGRTVAEVFPGLSSLQDEVPGKRERRLELLIRVDGNPRFYDVLVTPMDRGGTGSAGYLYLFRDVSARKQAELALAEANRKIGLLTSITRHDLTNKLMAVSSYLDLSRELATDPEQMEYLDREKEAIEAMNEQIEFTRDYEQLGTEIPAWQNVDAVVARMKAHIDKKQVTFTCTTARLEVYADPMFEKVFYNLFDNAMRYGGSNLSTLSVSSMTAGDDCVIIVEDDGAGIAPGDKALLFQRGFGKNTGLGLFLSREILAITGITIREAGKPGNGARFEIHVPPGKYR
jgi:PAS domain S-box-containing protein